ncbi:hypothetical protein EKO27_g6231 [Xylaria grammica]|uniref:Uncharacterized protein n=1 Tax=Xylaria grammica TaxID=363999 RepID=A0A439D360_9PEZI|nr:hypothetical protein EKO27_g6231 [Xylaria grammica]
MSSFNPSTLFEMLEKMRDQNLCPNRIWQACSLIKEWPSRQSTLQEILDGAFPKNSLRHEDHSACSIDFCEFSSRNFAAVQQYHELRLCDESDSMNENHDQKGVCFPLRNRFHDSKLVHAVQLGKLTAWCLDGGTLLEHPRPFMAISHVWSDGTGSGNWPSKQVHQCLFGYFRRIAERFQCEGIWWDTLCVPQDTAARSKALKSMHLNYQNARVTLVHDRFLRNLPFGGADMACLAIVASSWFTRGWTALELAKSRNVKIVFKDSIKDLDKHILGKAQKESFVAKAIKDLRQGRFSSVGDILATLAPRYTSWPRDRATIAGLLAGVEISDTNKDTFQRDIYQNILKKIGRISHDHLFHESITMSKGFSWCATNLFHLPLASTQGRLKVNDAGEVSGLWRFLSVDQLDLKSCLWGNSHELVEAKQQYALEKESNQHLLLLTRSREGPTIEKSKRGILVKILKNPCPEEKPRFKCQFVGSLYFSSALDDSRSVTIQTTIGDTEGWQPLNENENAWHIMEKENDLLPEGLLTGVVGTLGSQTIEPGTEFEAEDFHSASWLGDTSLAMLLTADRRTLLHQRDRLGRRAIHIAAERGHKAFIHMLLDNNDDPNSPIHSDNADNGQTPLHRAAWGGFLDVVGLLLSRGSNANAADRRGNTALHLAADMGFGEVVRRLCEQTQSSVNSQGRNGLTPLHYAALSGHYDVAEILISNNATINIKDSKIGWTALHCAAEDGNTSVIELLLARGAEVDVTDDKVGWTPLHLAAMSGRAATIEKLAEKADLDKEDINGFTPLAFAAINGHFAVVQRLIGHGATINNDTFNWSSEDVRSPNTVTEWLTTNAEKFRAKLSSVKWGRVYLAALDGYTQMTRLVVDGDICINEESVGNGDKLLHWAAKDGRLRVVRLLVQIGTSKMVEDNDGRTPVWWAATAGHDDVIQALFEDIDAEVGNTLLAQAVEEGHEVAVRALLRVGANIETRNRDGETLLYQAVRNRDEAIIRALCEAGANTEATNRYAYTPLLKAAKSGDESEGVVRLLLEAGANVEAADTYRYTPLLVAIRNKSERIVHLLLEAGANIEVTTRENYTPLMKAAESGDGSEGIIKKLLKKGANLEATDAFGYTPLLVAIQEKCEAVVRLLLGQGANMKIINYHGDTPLLLAARNGEGGEGIVRILLAAGDNIEAVNKAGQTPLLLAAQRKLGKGTVQALLEAGANTEAENGGETPLILAANSGHDEIVQVLLKAGANISAANRYGTTPLLAAAHRGHKEVAQMLLEAGANIEAVDNNGATPLCNAANWGHSDIVLMLIESGANIEAANDQGSTPLIRAAVGTYQEVVRILLEAGARIEATDTSGNTALLAAAMNSGRGSIEARRREEEIVQMLLEAGANSGVKNANGETPLSVAIARKQNNIVQALEGADRG